MFNLISGSLLVQPEVFASVQNLFRKVFDKYDRYNGDKLTVDNFDDNIRLGLCLMVFICRNGIFYKYW